MDLSILDPSLGGYVPAGSQHHYTHSDDKSSSHTSSPSSSTSDDIFSVTSDTSSQSSNGDLNDHSQVSSHFHDAGAKLSNAASDSLNAQKVFEQLPASQLQNPRRSSSLTKRAPPPLPRQEERKVLFVNDLVDSATSLVSVIWPLSSLPCGQSPNNKGVLPLRRYIEETLRRSRTSYSTLQVALYYLVLVKSHVPRADSFMEQTAGTNMRAMQCGRRMFLAALILASKYLQDRNYSAKAWSKMSGLKTTEINGNERMFLSAVNWKLHIPDHIFKRWTDIVLQFTAQPSPPSPTCGITTTDSKAVWSQLIPLLTPTLDDPRILSLPSKSRSQTLHLSLQIPGSTVSGPTTPVCTSASYALGSQDATPTPSTIAPRFLEPKADIFPPTPGLLRMGPLPTPVMTPSSIGSSTPAVSACSSRRPSMSTAMSQAQNSLLSRITQDRMPGNSLPHRSCSVRSMAPSVISCSSPESMISDLTRSSRSSSISSVSTAPTAAPHRAFARPAISRSTSSTLMTIDPSKLTIDGTAERPIKIFDDVNSNDLMVYQHDPYNFHSNGNNNSYVTPLGESRKRCRPQPGSGVDDNNLQSGVRSLLLASSADRMDIDADVRVAHSSVSDCALRRAMVSLARSSSLKTPEIIRTTACPIRRAVSAYRYPSNVDVESPRKRARCNLSQVQTPDLFMEVKDGVWQGVA